MTFLVRRALPPHVVRHRTVALPADAMLEATANLRAAPLADARKRSARKNITYFLFSKLTDAVIHVYAAAILVAVDRGYDSSCSLGG